MGYAARKAHSTLRGSPRYARNYPLGERVFRRSWFFGLLGSYGSFSYGAPTERLLPPFAYFSPTELCGERCTATAVKAHWGLNKSAGISATPSAKKPSDALGSRKEQINVRNRPQRFRQAISAERSEGYRAEFYLALPLRSELPHEQALKRHACQLLFVTFSFWERKS